MDTCQSYELILSGIKNYKKPDEIFRLTVSKYKFFYQAGITDDVLLSLLCTVNYCWAKERLLELCGFTQSD